MYDEDYLYDVVYRAVHDALTEAGLIDNDEDERRVREDAKWETRDGLRDLGLVPSSLPAGRYRVLVEEAKLDHDRRGNSLVKVHYRVVGGEHDGETIWDVFLMVEPLMFRMVGLMMSIGMPTPKARIRVNVRHFVGKELEIDLEDGYVAGFLWVQEIQKDASRA